MSFPLPKITKQDGSHFRIENVDVSIVNGLRRIILSDIPIYGFRGFPHKDNKINIMKNTTRFNNEIMKQRIACLPVHIHADNEEAKYYKFTLHKKNDREDNTTMYVTTQDFVVLDTRSDRELSPEEVEAIFPRNPLTRDHILITRLRPKMSEDFAGEEIHLEATLDIVTAGLDGAYNVVETCSYQNTADKDPVKLENAWKVKEASLTGLSEEELKKERKNWEIHDTQRIYIPNSYDFVIETIGIYTNAKLLKMACDIMLNKLETVEVTEIEHKKMNTDIVRGKLENEDYTYGKVIEYGLYHLYYEQQRKVSLVNFRKLHPHNTFGILRVDFKLDEEDVKERYTEYYERVKTELKQIFTAIKATF